MPNKSSKELLGEEPKPKRKAKRSKRKTKRSKRKAKRSKRKAKRSKRKRKSKRKSKKRFGSTGYQKQVNGLTGAMGPTRGAFWNSYTTLTGPAYDLAAQPMYYNPAIGEYVTSNAMSAGPASINIYPAGTANFSSSFGARTRRCQAHTNEGKRCKCKTSNQSKMCNHHQ